MRSGNDSAKGFYRKFFVERADGSSKVGGKHEDCEYFVLDLEHDQYATPALEAYADACVAQFPLLASDLRLKAKRVREAMKLSEPAPAGDVRDISYGHLWHQVEQFVGGGDSTLLSEYWKEFRNKNGSQTVRVTFDVGERPTDAVASGGKGGA